MGVVLIKIEGGKNAKNDYVIYVNDVLAENESRKNGENCHESPDQLYARYL